MVLHVLPIRKMNIFALLESAWQDLAYAARTFRLNKGFFAVAMLSLALGIGANTAIFQLLDAVRLRALPVSRADQLAELKISKNEHCCSGNFSDRHSDFTWRRLEKSSAYIQRRGRGPPHVRR